MFEVPGTAVKYVLISKGCVLSTEKPLYFSRNQEGEMLQALKDEDADCAAADPLGSQEQAVNC